jgi:hypothetical protein
VTLTDKALIEIGTSRNDIYIDREKYKGKYKDKKRPSITLGLFLIG